MPIPNRVILELRPRDGSDLGFDFEALVVAASNRRHFDFDFSKCSGHVIVDPVASYRLDFLRHIERHGEESLRSGGMLMEALVLPSASTADVLAVMHAHLEKIAVQTELVIIDPYFFPSHADPAYAVFVENVLDPVLTPALRKITLITNRPTYIERGHLADITTRLTTRVPTLQLSHRSTRKFHDRFWINPVFPKGFLSGTSLSGLGNKYAVVGELEQQDTVDILASLQHERLI